MNTLRSKLDAEISKEGAISFVRFMQLALYEPGLGYYERRNAVGTKGDFYTSVSVGSLFGELLACQFTRWLSTMEAPRFRLIEAAAHRGDLARDILGWLASHEPHLFERIDYIILEPSETLRAQQRLALESVFDCVRWVESWTQIQGKTRGIIFSNELLDAFPVKIIAWDKTAHRWSELGVTRAGESYRWVELTGDLPKEEVPDLPEELLVLLPDGFRTEVNHAATDWWRSAADMLKEGWLLTLDYGLDSEEFFVPQRAAGTVRAYRDHRPADDLFADIGDQDITANVDFSKLRRAGEERGLETILETSQTRFLTEIVRALEGDSGFGQWTPERLRQFQTLTHPEHLGRKFRVLAQERRLRSGSM